MGDSDGTEPQPISPYEWVEIVSRVRLGTVVVRPASTPGGRELTVAGRMVKAVAFRLAFYANADGTSVRPGPARLAVVCEVDYKSVKSAYAVLRGLGLLTQTAFARGPQGTRGRSADEYRLTLPEDLLDRVQVLSPLEMDREIERVRETGRGHRGPGVGGRPTPSNPDSPQGVDNQELEGAEHPPTEHHAEKVGGCSASTNPELGGAGHPSWGVLDTRIPTNDLPTKATNHDPVPAQPHDARAPTAPESDAPEIPPPRFAGATS